MTELCEPNPNDCSRVVLIEDDQAIRESVQEILELEGYEVTTFSNGKEAIEGLKPQISPCLILLDLMMPIMDGWQFLEARKHIRDKITAIPIVVVSAWAEQAKNAEGVSGYIKKPLDLEILLKIVSKYCRQNH